MEVEKINKNWKKSLILFIDDILELEIWINKKSFIYYRKSIDDYFEQSIEYKKIRKDNKFNLLIKTLEEYSFALEDDWLLVDKIIGLDIKKAYSFLEEIKNILLNSEDNEIENQLIDTYKKIEKNSNKMISKKYSLVEIKFQPKKDFINQLIKLEYYTILLTNSKILGEGIEHDSIHYIEFTYYKWIKGDVKVKLYIDDYSENGLCFDISSNSQEKCNEVSKKLIKLLESELIDIQITKNWEK